MSNATKPAIGLFAITDTLCRHRNLIFQLARREVLARYKGSMFGLLWAVISPIVMLCVYTFVFSTIFKARWGLADESQLDYAFLLFSGLIVFNFFSEVINAAPTILVANTNFIKRIVFPLEILIASRTLAGLFTLFVNYGVLIIGFGLLQSTFHLTAILMPIIILPLMIMVLGLGWMLSSLGLFLRDIGQSITIITTIMLFLSPIFYPVTALPEAYQAAIHLNPLTPVIEMTRDIVIFGNLPDAKMYVLNMLVSVVVAWGGFIFFQVTRKGFADVV